MMKLLFRSNTAAVLKRVNKRSLPPHTKYLCTAASSGSKNVLQPNLTGLSKQSSLDTPLPNLPTLKPASDLPSPQTKSTVLPNGLRIISQETYGQAATLGLYIEAGSRYEDSQTAGAAHALQHLFFKSTNTKSHAALVHELESIGASVNAIGTKEQVSFTIELLRDYLPAGLSILADSLINPALVEQEVADIRQILAIEAEELAENPHGIVHERIHEAAYGPNSSLGRPTIANFADIPNVTVSNLELFLQKYVTAPRIVLAATGVEHERLVSEASNLFKSVRKESSTVASSSSSSSPCKYTGGSVIIPAADSTFSHAALAFNTTGWHGGDDLIHMCVLQMLLGGGDSFSAGGPGKGMYSRLYTTVLNRHYWVESATAFTSLHDDAGLIGIYGACLPENGRNLAAVLCNQFINIAKEAVSSSELSRAKNQLKSSIMMNLESRSILNEDIGRQVLTYGKREDPEVICSKIDKVTPSSLQRIASKVVTNCKPSVVFYGNPENFPTYDQVANAISEGLKA